MSISAHAPVPAGGRLIDADTVNLTGIPRPRRACPISWCIGCDRPDPGVTVHLSRTWSGADRYDGARWRIQVTQRHTPTGVLPAVVDVTAADGSFADLTAMAADLLAADALAKHINDAGAPSNRRLVWAGCGKPATIRIEVYSAAGGSLYGSLDASVYTCEEHGIPAVSAVYAVGLTPYRASAPLNLSRTCGFIYRYPTAGGAQ